MHLFFPSQNKTHVMTSEVQTSQEDLWKAVSQF